MRWRAFLCASLMAAGRLAADSGADERRLDPALKLLYRAYSAAGAPRQAIGLERSREILGLFQSAGADGRHPAASLLVMIQFKGDEEQLAPNGFEVRSHLGSVYTGLLDPDRLSDLLAVPGVSFVQLSRALHPFHEPGTARRALAATGEAATENLSLAAGAGVLIGFIDTGVDVHHQDFRRPDGTTRIKLLLDLSDPGDTDGDGRLDGPDDFGGTLYTEAEINAALRSTGSLRQKDVTGHGTLGLSVAAGDDPALPGIAPAAELIVVKATRHDGNLTFESSDVLDALSFIDRKAEQLGRPWVVNLSLGSAFGPHDGRTLEELAIDSLVGPGIPGKVVVLAAGNSGEGGNRFRHFQGTAYSGLETRHVLTIPSYDEQIPGVDNDTALLDLWYEGNDRLTVRVTAPDGVTTVEAPYGDFADEPTPFGQVFIGNMGGASPLNGDVEAVVLLYDRSGIAPAAGDWTISLIGERIEAGGVYHGWLVDGASRVGGVEPHLSSDADNRFLVGRPGSAANGITVGSFARHDPAGRYRTSWTDVRGILRTDITAHAEDLSIFSSAGATRDGRVKPEIVAPGERVLGAVSQDADPSLVPGSLFRDHPFPEPDALMVDATPDHGFGLLQGTSFAAPTVTGLVARILSADPDLDAVQVRNILINAASSDAFTGAVPNDLWGYGKADLSLAADPSRPLPPSLRIASEPLADGVPGRQYNHVFTALGGSLPYAWSVIGGTLPPGLSLAGALLTGVPTSAGAWRFTLQAEDSSPVQQVAQRVCEIRIEPKPALGIVTKRLPPARIGHAYAVALQGEGGTPPYAWSLVGGSLPPGLSLQADGRVQGMPAALEAKSFTVKLADATGSQVRRSLTLHATSGAGDEWRQVGTSLITAFDIVIDPNDRQHLFAGVSGAYGVSAGSVMESTDGGVSWNDISRNNGLADNAFSLAINPVDSTLWALAESPSYYDRVGKQWRHWNYCPGTPAKSYLQDLEFAATGNLYILPYLFECLQRPSLNQFYGFLHSGDGGATFQNIGSFPTARNTTSFSFGSLAISRSRPDVMYAGRYTGCTGNTCGDNENFRLEERFYRSQDGGRTWVDLPVSINYNLDPRVSPDDPFDVLRFSSNPLYASSFLERKFIERSVDGGLTWTNLALPGEPAVCRVEQSQADPDVLLAQTDAGFFRSTDHGLHWTEMLIEGLNITHCSWGAGMAFDPFDADRMFVAARDYTMFATTDGGTTWKARGSGLTIRPMNGIAVSPARPSDLLTVSGLPHVSRNLGERWTLSAAGVDTSILYDGYGTPLISPKDPNLYYFYNYYQDLYRSDNAGLTWKKLPASFETGYDFQSLAADPFDANILLARVSQSSGRPTFSQGMWRSHDRGETWLQVSEVNPAPLPKGSSNQWEPEIAFDPRTPGRVYALGPEGIYLSNDRGSSWNLLTQLSGGSPMVLDVAPSDPRYLYAIRGQMLSAFDAAAGIWRTSLSSGRLISLAVDSADPRVAYAGRWYIDPGSPPNGSGGIDKTTDAGRTWTRLAGFPTSLSVIGLVAHPTRSGTIFAATKEDGVYRTADGGATWQKLDNYGAVADLVNVALPDPANRFILYVGTQGFGVQVSTDGGKTFLPRVTGLGNLNVTSLAFDAGAPTILYAGTEDGLFKTTDGGETWQRTAFADGLVTDISVDSGTRPRRVRIITLNGVGVSQDEGGTFSFSSAGLSSLNLTSIEAEPRGTSIRLWVTQRGGDGVAFSDDQGRTWKPAAGNGLRDRDVNDLAIEGHRLWVATDGGVFFSDDAGLSWSPLDAGLPVGVPVTSVSIDPNSHEVLVSLFDREGGGVYRGANLRGSWSAFNEGLSDFRVRKLTHGEGHPLSGTTLGATFYAATSGGGLFTTELETISATAPAVANPALPDGALGTPYAATLSAAGGVPPYFWSLAAGSLPPGLGLDPAGRIDGTPVQAGLFRFTLQVTDAASGVGQRDLAIQVHDGSTFLRVLKDGSGTGTVASEPAGILCGSDCGEPFPAGTPVTLQAAPASGSIFAGWGGACSGKGVCSLTVSTTHTAVATFNSSGPRLTVVKAGNGAGTVTSKPKGINCGSDCSETFRAKTRVTLSAKPAAGSVFAGWSGGGCSGTGSCKVTMTAAREVTATFSRKN